MRGLAGWLVDNRDGDLGLLEAGLIERGHALLAGLLGAALATAPAGEGGQERDCPGCRVRMRGLGRREKWLHLSVR
ncbi:MAG: hypothetical protein M3506_05905, partial [Chloroflexota bacterium]|nr:hypothetical protein [Chloroflexota bacterium]